MYYTTYSNKELYAKSQGKFFTINKQHFRLQPMTELGSPSRKLSLKVNESHLQTSSTISQYKPLRDWGVLRAICELCTFLTY